MPGGVAVGGRGVLVGGRGVAVDTRAIVGNKVRVGVCVRVGVNVMVAVSCIVGVGVAVGGCTVVTPTAGSTTPAIKKKTPIGSSAFRRLPEGSGIATIASSGINALTINPAPISARTTPENINPVTV